MVLAVAVFPQVPSVLFLPFLLPLHRCLRSIVLVLPQALTALQQVQPSGQEGVFQVYQ